jgi:EAL domain-containing protein (putative c-di-GMP-specific phosphodiesterase class I)/CheY-like chemotaxis protein
MRERNLPTILFVDDQPEVTAALELAFYKKPFKVYTSNSASDALDLLARIPIDVVISDEQMPVMSGSQFLTLVRRDFPAATRIILSGQANFRATLAAINEARAHHFLVKPCPPDDIADCIAKALDEREQGLGGDPLARHTEEKRLETSRQFDLAMEKLWVAFQPIIRAGEAEVFAYEALVRSHHPELKTPYQLFDAAEEFGRVPELERRIRVLIAKRVEELAGDVSVMVNLHPRSLGDEDLYSPDSPLFLVRHRVILEITERDKFHEVPGSGRGLTRLRDLGYRVAVDDLGAGYAGLNSFAMIRPDVVKFDMELIRDIDRSKTKCNLVRLMTTLCKEMGILTVAEGIETEEEYAKVRELGCDLLQGFFIAKPASNFAEPAPVVPEYSEGIL